MRALRAGDPAAPVLVGRAVELDHLHAAFARAAAGRAQVVVVEGDPGMGKSALLERFLGGLGDDATVRWVRCEPFDQHVTFRTAVRLLDEHTPADGSTIGVGRRLIASIGDLGARSPVAAVLAVDDAQWLDASTAAALRFALHRLRDDRVLCLFAVRPDPSRPELRTEDPEDTTVIRLGPLDAAGVVELARAARDLDVPDRLADQLVSHTGGLPLLVAGLVRDARGVADLEPGADLPASAAAAVERMMSSVDGSTRRLVEAAAVMETPTELAVLGAVADVAEPSRALGTATTAGLATLRPTGLVECAHALVGRAVRDELTPARRRELHARAASWATGNRRLLHRAEAAHGPDPSLVAELDAAADAAHRARRYRLAADHRLRARDVSDDGPERERLLLDALQDRVDGQDLPGARALVPLVQEAAPTARRSLALGLLARESGDVPGARALLGDALDRAVAEDAPATGGRAALAAAVLEVRVGNGAEAVRLLHGVTPSDAEDAVDALTTAGIGLWLTGGAGRAADLLDGFVPTPGGQAWEADLLATRGMVHLFAGRPRRALIDLDRAIDLVHLWRPSTNQSRTYVLRASARYVVGDWDGAAVDAASARALATGAAEPWSLALALAISADVPAGRGQWELAGDYVERAATAAPPAQSVSDMVTRRAVALAAARADHDGVLAVLDRVWGDAYLEREARTGALPPVIHARVAACLGVGRRADALADVHRYEGLRRRWPIGILPPALGWLRGQLAEADGQPGEAERAYAAELADPGLVEFPFLQAQVLHTSGRLLHATGNRREAVNRLVRARDAFAALRAAPYLERCDADLVACGLPSRAPDPLTLTPREEDVMTLVLRGSSNKQVAAELFLTVKTVEHHLRNIYAKLGVDGRHELRRLRGRRSRRDGRGRPPTRPLRP